MYFGSTRLESGGQEGIEIVAEKLFGKVGIVKLFRCLDIIVFVMRNALHFEMAL